LGALSAMDLLRGFAGVFQVLRGSHAPAAVFAQSLICCGCLLELLVIWHYWKGRDWARVCVLGWSFVVAFREMSSFIDHNADLASLMSRPLRFFHAVAAIFLLYWLNTRTVRAWFKKMSATTADLIADHLVGQLCIAVGKDDGGWRIAFEHDAEVMLHCPWRVVVDDNLAFASPAGAVTPTAERDTERDTERNPARKPSADEDEVRRLLENLRVKAVRVRPRTSDLFLSFEMGIELQTWSADPRAEDWRFSDPLLTVTADGDSLSSRLADSIAEQSADIRATTTRSSPGRGD
jgi:hypothetical protein